jgi:hypothetical protein
MILLLGMHYIFMRMRMDLNCGSMRVAKLWTFLVRLFRIIYFLEFAYFCDGQFKPSVFESVEFNTPIRQITGIAASQHFIAVRSWDGVTFLEVIKKDESAVTFEMINFHRFKRPPLHVEWHQVIFGQAIIRLEGGPCYLWDISNSANDR